MCWTTHLNTIAPHTHINTILPHNEYPTIYTKYVISHVQRYTILPSEVPYCNNLRTQPATAAHLNTIQSHVPSVHCAASCLLSAPSVFYLSGLCQAPRGATTLLMPPTMLSWRQTPHSGSFQTCPSSPLGPPAFILTTCGFLEQSYLPGGEIDYTVDRACFSD